MAKQSGEVSIAKKKDTPAETPLPALFGGFPPIEGLRREVDSLFENFNKGWPRFWDFDPFKGVSQPFTLPSFAAAPRVDVKESDDAYEIAAELPGLDEKDIELALRGDVLSISGEKKAEREEKKKDYYLSERSYGAFHRSFRVPENVDADKIGAKFAKGVLTVTLPKTAEAKKKQRKIAIKGN